MKIVLIALFVFFIVVTFMIIALKGKSKKRVVFKKSAIMTKSELEFWRVLVPAAAPLHVGPQVAMGALLKTVSGLEKAESTSARNSFDRKRVDFVLFDDTGLVQLIVELDDSSHRSAKDALRDAMTDSAGYCTLRLHRRDAPNAGALAALILAKLSPSVPDRVPAAA